MRAFTRVVLAAIVALAAIVVAGLVRPILPAPWALAGSVAILLSLPVLPIAIMRWVRPPTSAMMLRAKRLSESGAIAFEWVDLKDISRPMQLAAVAAEDAYFRHHAGFDWESIRAAREYNQTHTHKRGGSTITQQVAKNLFLWPERSYVRKILEAYLTLLIEAIWPKRRILEVYLNIAQFGPDVFGVEAAARRYFDKPARLLGEHEAALLAASLPSPVRYQVSSPSHQLRFRQTWVLTSMRRLDDAYLEHL